MNNWIDEESEKLRNSSDARKQKEYIINYSNYWSALKDQIIKDVERINASPELRAALGENVKVENTINGYKITKPSFPNAFTINVENQADEIILKIDVKPNSFSPYQSSEESLTVESDEKTLYLKKYNQMFLIPEQASKYILSTVIKSIN